MSLRHQWSDFRAIQQFADYESIVRTRLSEDNLSSDPFKEMQSQHFLELSDVSAHSTLRQSKLLTGAREAPSPSGSLECEEGAQRGKKPFHRFMSLWNEFITVLTLCVFCKRCQTAERRAVGDCMMMKRAALCITLLSSFAFAQSSSAAEVKVAYLPCGTINDKSWSEAGYVGVVAAKEALAAKGVQMSFVYSENTPPARVEAAARDYATQGYSIVILHCGTYGQAAVNAARAFPKTIFLHSTAPADKNPPPNFFYYDIAQQEGSFIGGYLGGLTSKSNKIASIGGFTFPAMVRQVEGFLLGARYANQNAKLGRTYINTFDDAVKAKEAAQAQIDEGVDVIYGATDQAARGIFAAAQSAGVYAVADYADQASLAPKAILASVLYDFGGLVKLMIVDGAEGKLDHSKSYVLGMHDGFGTVVLNPALDAVIPNSTKEKIAKVTGDITSGRMKIPFDALSVSDSADKVDLTPFPSELGEDVERNWNASEQRAFESGVLHHSAGGSYSCRHTNFFAALGEAFAENAGILNISVEGMMALGAFSGLVVAFWTDSSWIGFGCALLVGASAGAVFGFLTIERGADQIITGIVMNLTCFGIVSLLIRRCLPPQRRCRKSKRCLR